MEQRFKHPRIPYVSWSPSLPDDAILVDATVFRGYECIVTEKMDGENTTLYRDGLHARSINGRHHPSQDWIRARHAEIAHLIPEGVRICGENLYARHSIQYTCLEDYFYVHSVWQGERCLSWQETLNISADLGLWTVWPWAYVSSVEEEDWDALWKAFQSPCHTTEGYVIRRLDGFNLADYGHAVAKWVRENHVQTNQHWSHGPVVKNELTKSRAHRTLESGPRPMFSRNPETR